MKIEKTAEINPGDSLVTIIYGKGGVGKTSFAASAPDCLLLDFENGSKYLGERGINIDVIRFDAWFTEGDTKQLSGLIQSYKTIAVDPLGEVMEKIIDSPRLNSKKYRQADGSLTMAGWGEAKAMLIRFIKWLRDTGKYIILIAHDDEQKDGETICHRLQVQTKARDVIQNMVDVVGYLGVSKEGSRILYTPRQTDRFDSKDRTGRLPEMVNISEKNGFQDYLGAMKPIESPINTPVEEKRPVGEIPGMAPDVPQANDLIGIKQKLMEHIDVLAAAKVVTREVADSQRAWVAGMSDKAALEKARIKIEEKIQAIAEEEIA